MSIDGLKQFSDNLNFLMETKKFKKSKNSDKMKLGIMLLRSEYGG